MIRIRILSGEVFSRKVHSNRTGKDYNFRDQMGVALCGGDSQPCKVSLRDDEPAYGPGLYEVLDESFYVDRDQKIALGRLRLRPVADAAVSGAPAAPRPVAAVGGK